MILRVVGAFLVINAIAYAVQFVFNDLYQDGQGLEPKHIWQVIDYVAVVVILAALVVNFMKLRSLPPSGGEAISGERLGAYMLFYATAALILWLFHNWIDLLTLPEGKSVSVYNNVIWKFIGVVFPLTIGTTGCILWREASDG